MMVYVLDVNGQPLMPRKMWLCTQTVEEQQSSGRKWQSVYNPVAL